MIQHQARKGSHEFFLEGAFTGAVLSAGANDLGYPCIVGAGVGKKSPMFRASQRNPIFAFPSGPNAAILHYEANRSQIQLGDLVLIDAGAEVRRRGRFDEAVGIYGLIPARHS
eukprot:1154842-Pelagomonas_calceolata.AAC.1